VVSGAVAGGLVAEHAPAWLPAVILTPLAVVVIASITFELADTRAGPRRDRDDRRPARDLLGDDVQPVALDGQVRLQDARHQVPQAVRPFGGAQHVIVDVLVVGL